jgi:hypothetical protein
VLQAAGIDEPDTAVAQINVTVQHYSVLIDHAAADIWHSGRQG